MKIFLQSLADILEVDEVKPTDLLADFEEWDSLSVLSIMAMVDADHHVTLSAGEIKGIGTAENLWKHIEGKRA